MASTPPPQAYSTRPFPPFRLLWLFRRVRRPRGQCSFALSVGSLSWRTRRSRFRSRRSGSVKSSKPDSPNGVVFPSQCVRRVLSGIWLSPSQPLRHQGQLQASSICVSSAGSSSMETRCPASSFGYPRRLHLSSVCSAPSGHHESHRVGGSPITPSSSTLASERVVCGPTGPHRRTSLTSKSVESPCTVSPASRMDFIQRLVRKAGFSQKVASVAAADLRRSTAAISQSKWSRFLDWCGRRGVNPCNASILVIAKFFLHLHQDLGFSVTAVRLQGSLTSRLHAHRDRSPASSVVSRGGPTLLMKSVHPTGTLLLFSIVCRGRLLNPSCWPWTNI